MCDRDDLRDRKMNIKKTYLLGTELYGNGLNTSGSNSDRLWVRGWIWKQNHQRSCLFFLGCGLWDSWECIVEQKQWSQERRQREYKRLEIISVRDRNKAERKWKFISFPLKPSWQEIQVSLSFTFLHLSHREFVTIKMCSVSRKVY